jgi:hypothetical protein
MVSNRYLVRTGADLGFSIFLVFFVVSMQQQIQFNLSYYVTSSFALLPLTGTTSIVSGIVGGVFKLPTAKFIDLVGRAEGFALMTGFTTLGEFKSPKKLDVC